MLCKMLSDIKHYKFEKLLALSLNEVSLLVLKHANRFVCHGDFFSEFQFLLQKAQESFY